MAKMISIKMTEDDLGDLLSLMTSAVNPRNGTRMYFDRETGKSESADDKCRRILARINASTGKGLIMPNDLPESVRNRMAKNPGKPVTLTKHEQAKIAATKKGIKKPHKKQVEK